MVGPLRSADPSVCADLSANLILHVAYRSTHAYITRTGWRAEMATWAMGCASLADNCGCAYRHGRWFLTAKGAWAEGASTNNYTSMMNKL